MITSKYEYAWHFEIAKEAGMAHNEDGSPSDCYTRVKLGFNEPKTVEEVDGLGPKIATLVANQLEIPVEWIKPITKEQYDTENEDDEFEEE